jgi:hypothetical protein
LKIDDTRSYRVKVLPHSPFTQEPAPIGA